MFKMFWSGNYIAGREVKLLLKEENVTLTQVLEAEDVLHECRADNKALTQFLIKPEIRAELITLITEEPPKHVELASQYRHANIASEVLTSQLTLLRDHLVMDTVQMNRLCDFVNKDPPLNPLLASYFSKTIEMLLVQSPKQDWYGHRIGCIQVLDFFKSRRDFLPNLLRHMSTSAICDVLKCFLHLGDFNKIIVEWFDEYQFLECLIQIICGTYEPEELHSPALEHTDRQTEHDEKDQIEQSEKADVNHKPPENEGETDKECNRIDDTPERRRNGETDVSSDKETSSLEAKDNSEQTRKAAERRRARLREVASSNAEALLSDIVLRPCARDLWTNSHTCGGRGACAKLCGRLRCAEGVRALLAGAFTAPPAAAHAALVHAARLLLRLLAPAHDVEGESDGAAAEEEVVNVERAVAPHVPLLHNALLRPPEHGQGRGVGEARVAAAAVLARLASSELHDVLTALLSLGTAHVLLDLVFAHPDNNFLHAQVYVFVRNALRNARHDDVYAHHLIEECHLTRRLMDAFDEFEDKVENGPEAPRRPRAGYMGHAVAMLRLLDEREGGGEPACAEGEEERWAALRGERLLPLLTRLDTPLGGSYPSENQYELAEGVEGVEGMEGAGAEEARDGVQLENVRITHDDLLDKLQNRGRILDISRIGASSSGGFGMWDDNDSDELQQELDDVSPWDSCAGAGDDGGEGGEAGWAQFDAFPASAWGAAPQHTDADGQSGLDHDMAELHVGDQGSRLQDALTIELAHKMLHAISGMADDPSQVADLSGDSGHPSESSGTFVTGTQIESEPVGKPVTDLPEPPQLEGRSDSDRLPTSATQPRPDAVEDTQSSAIASEAPPPAQEERPPADTSSGDAACSVDEPLSENAER